MTYKRNVTIKQYIWKNGDFVSKELAVTSVLAHSLHYGSAVFEGIRAYETCKGPAILKLDEHIVRFKYSMQSLGMQCPYSQDELKKAIIDTVNKNSFTPCYIRPLAYFTDAGLYLLPKDNYPVDMVICCLPINNRYVDTSINVKISQYMRIHPQSTMINVKVSGHYINSLFALREIIGTPYHEVLLLDYNGKIAEGSAQNIFIVSKNNIITPKPGNIFSGITRKFIIEIARRHEINVIEKELDPDDIYNADEAFLCGTAAEIIPIRSVDDFVIGLPDNTGNITKKIINTFKQITTAKIESNALTFI